MKVLAKPIERVMAWLIKRVPAWSTAVWFLLLMGSMDVKAKNPAAWALLVVATVALAFLTVAGIFRFLRETIAENKATDTPRPPGGVDWMGMQDHMATTASFFAGYRQQLLEAGFSEEAAEDLVVAASDGIWAIGSK